jgi:hypothetical protein
VGEVKFVILLSPFLLALLWILPGYVSGVSKVSLRSLLIIAAGMALLIFVAITVLASNYSAAFGGDPTKSALSVFIDSLGYIFDTNYIMPSGELGRFTTVSSGSSITNFSARAGCCLATVLTPPTAAVPSRRAISAPGIT